MLMDVVTVALVRSWASERSAVHRRFARQGHGRLVVAVAFGLAATLACNNELTQPPVVSASMVAADALATAATSIGRDRAALVAFYHATNGPGWINSENWMSNEPLDEWWGVSADSSGAVRGLILHGNDLTGELPPSLGGLADLRDLRLYGNAGLLGALPDSLANLVRLEDFHVGGTRICARPDDFAIQLWLRSMRTFYVPSCRKSAAYVVQAVQSPDVPVPLVAGRPGLLRVFVAHPDARQVPVPSAWATFYQTDGTRHSVRVRSGNGAIPADVDVAESSLSLSANVEVPGEVLRPGVEMVVVLDPPPDHGLDALGVPQRIPKMGRMALDVREMPLFEVTVMPVLRESEPDSSVLELTKGLTVESSLFETTRRLLPVGTMSVTVHQPVWTSGATWSDILHEVNAIRILEGGVGYFIGVLPSPFDGIGAIAYTPGRAMVSILEPGIIAKMFGFNLSLGRAPCGVQHPTNPGYPYPHAGGISGAWGYRSGDLVPPSEPDLMGYCNGNGISDYHFEKALRWRRNDGTGIGDFAGPFANALLLWGGVDADGRPFLNPAFVAEARPSLQSRSGAWRVVGEDREGRLLFDRRFEMVATATGDGRISFALVLPAESGWAETLTRIVLTGPDGTVAMNAATGRTAALLRDPDTGQVRGILRNWPRQGGAGKAAASRTLPEPGLEIQVSTGVPRPDAWHR